MRVPSRFQAAGALVLALSCIAGGAFGQEAGGGEAAASGPAVEFNRDIRPILSDYCYQCHGPDKAQRKADLRLDVEAVALADLGGRRALVPGDLDASELYQRISSDDDTERMPPPAMKRRLSPNQVRLIGRWIEQGAKWQKHWSFLPPVRSPVPPVRDAARVRNPIDAFILARLEREGLSPAPEADRTTLIRRVSLDLTGLPPTPEEVDAFVNDTSPDAYEKVVDRLLDSPRYGERMAVRWLDGARYADTNGYQSDGERYMWRWRDWVIDAYNSNMPFDRFTIEQIAGDMLPEPTLEQLIATGFNRNHRGNAEGGIIPEEYAVEYVVDRVETTYTVWLGLTMGCARCHEHKFDPFTQKEFYQAFAYFNNVPEYGRAIKYGNSPPMIKAPTREQTRKFAELERAFASARAEYAQRESDIAAAQARWEQTVDAATLPEVSVTEGLVAHYPLDGSLAQAAAPRTTAAQKSNANAAGSGGGTGSAAAKAEDAAPRFEDGDAAFASGRVRQAAEFNGSRFVSAGDVAPFGFYDKFTLAAWIYPRGDKGGTIVARMTDAEHADGYSLVLEDGRVQANYVKRWLDDALRVESERRLEPETWHHVLVTYDGTRLASGVRLFIDGRPEPLRVALDLLNQTFTTKEPLRIGGGNGPEGRFHGAIDDVRVYDRVLSAEEAAIVAVADMPAAILATPSANRPAGQALKVRTLFLERDAPEELRQARQRVIALDKEREQLVEAFPTTMVMQEMPEPRETHVLLRGVYDKPGEKVAPGVPDCLAPLPADVPNNRLGLARWLVDPANPLTARVAVNRLWQMVFGAGLVKTVDDFGAQGEWPSHPELLDWLAVELVSPMAAVSGSGGPRDSLAPTPWNIKRLLRLIVTSATYCQSSRVTPAVAQRDPDNRLLARGPRLRHSAEMVRDQALFAAGLLVERLGGPSVKPYQPDGLWKELADTDYVQDHGENLYRRSMYTFWKRTVAPPTMLTFDAAGRETCVVRETRTNTPLQALTLMNEITFVEASRMLAERVMKSGGTTPEERLTLAFRLCTSRPPRPAELQVLATSLAAHRERYARDPAAAVKLVSIGESPRDERLDASELAAYAAVCGMILNLDEAITKE